MEGREEKEEGWEMGGKGGEGERERDESVTLSVILVINYFGNLHFSTDSFMLS